MSETLPNTTLTEEVDRDLEHRRSRGDDIYARMADEIATTITTGKARLCKITEGEEIVNWQSYIRYYLRKRKLKLVYRNQGNGYVRAWAEPLVKKDSPK